MKVTIKHAEESTLEEFAEKHGLEMFVEESPRHEKGSDYLYSATLKGEFLKHPSRWGHGATPKAAIADYANRISGTIIETEEIEAVCMFFASYKFIRVPRLVKK